MAFDPAMEAAAMAVALEDRIEREITRHGGPVGYLLAMQRRQAMSAAHELVASVDPSDTHRIIYLRLRIEMFHEMCNGLRIAIEEGRRAWDTMEERDRAAFAEILVEQQDQELD